jgi:hypothetical protein
MPTLEKCREGTRRWRRPLLVLPSHLSLTPSITFDNSRQAASAVH